MQSVIIKVAFIKHSNISNYAVAIYNIKLIFHCYSIHIFWNIIRYTLAVDELSFTIITESYFICTYRISKKTYRCYNTRNNCDHNNPESRLFIVKHRFYSVLYTYLTKSKRTSCNHTAINTASQQSLRIVCFLYIIKLFNNFLVTGKLDISAKQNVCKPHNRVKPVQSQNYKTKRFP